MGLNFYENQINQVENIQEIKSEFGSLIDDYIESKNDTEESYFFKKGIIGKAKNLNQSEYDSLIKYINSKREKSTGDDKLQLLNLWSALTDTDIKEKKEIVGKKDFEIIGGKTGKYEFFGCNFENIGNNRYKVFTSFKKRQNRYINYGKDKSFLIQYEGHNVIKYYNEKGKYLGIGVIDHKQENINIIKRKYNKFYQKTNRNYKDISNDGKKSHSINREQITTNSSSTLYQKNYNKGAIQRIYFEKIDIYLDLMFHEKEKTD